MAFEAISGSRLSHSSVRKVTPNIHIIVVIISGIISVIMIVIIIINSDQILNCSVTNHCEFAQLILDPSVRIMREDNFANFKVNLSCGNTARQPKLGLVAQSTLPPYNLPQRRCHLSVGNSQHGCTDLSSHTLGRMSQGGSFEQRGHLSPCQREREADLSQR